MQKEKVLFMGESWVIYMTHQKGFDMFTNSTYEEGADALIKILEKNFDVTYIPGHEVPLKAPNAMEELKKYKAVILSDIGANSFYLHPDTFSNGVRTPNRIRLLEEYVKEGGGLCMVGGYLTFQGIDGKGHWKNTAVEKALPIEFEIFDDREECPEGINPIAVEKNHPILKNIDETFPYFLGYNRSMLKEGASLVAKINEHPFIASWDYHNGRSAIFSSDCAPHWGSHEFMAWKHYATLWTNIINWVCKKI